MVAYYCGRFALINSHAYILDTLVLILIVAIEIVVFV